MIRKDIFKLLESDIKKTIVNRLKIQLLILLNIFESTF